MNNLFSKETKVYQKKLSEREVYEQERFCLLKVEDGTGIIEEKGGDSFVQNMFEHLQNRNLNRFVYDEIDKTHYDITVKISCRSGDIVAKVIISKRQISQEIKELLSRVLKKILDI